MKEITELKSPQYTITPPTNPKKITGTRFATIMGMNAWQTPFQAWSQITRTYEPPFEDTIYTTAGKVIEPILINYLGRMYYDNERIVTPVKKYGKDFFNKTRGDFFPDWQIFGGMWDALLMTKDGKVERVLEIKTTKRAEDWQDSPPIYYTLQAALYAHLLGCNDFTLIVGFLNDGDYSAPENFKPTAANTAIFEMNIPRDLPDFPSYITKAVKFWENYVLTGISPYYDEKLDKEYLDGIRTNVVEISNPAMLDELDQLTAELAEFNAKIAPIKKRQTLLSNALKEHLIASFSDTDTKATMESKRYQYTVSKSSRPTIDTEKLKLAGLYDKYLTTATSYTLRVKEI